MSAWLSFFGGYAQGANEQIDEQRKREDQYIQDRMKMAAATRLEKQKEAEKQRKELQDADLSLSINEDYKNAPTAVKIAMLSSPELREVYSARKKVDPATTVLDIVATSPQTEEIAKKYNTVDQWRSSFQAKPKAVDQQTMEAFNAPRQAFGARVGSGRDQLAQNAARFGMKPDEALGWESGGEELPSMNVGATLKQGALAPTDIKSQRQLVESKLLRANRLVQEGKREEGNRLLDEAKMEAITLNAQEKILEGEPDPKWSAQKDAIRKELFASNDDARRKVLERQLVEMDRIENLGKPAPDKADKTPSFNNLYSAALGAGVARAKLALGDKYKDLVIDIAADGTPKVDYVGNDLAKQREIQLLIKNTANKVLQPWMNTTNGRLASQRLGIGLEAQVEAEEQLDSQRRAREATGGSPKVLSPTAPKTLQPQAAPNRLTDAGGLMDQASMPQQVATMAPRGTPSAPPSLTPRKTITEARLKASANGDPELEALLRKSFQVVN
jgi:hypothetical protein